MNTYNAPPFDAELGAALAIMAQTMPPTTLPEAILPTREALNVPDPTLAALVEQLGLTHEERTIPGYDGAEILVSIYKDPNQTTAGPGIFHTHGGGMIVGNRFLGIQAFLPFIISHNATVVSVEYRLAPEFPDPVPVEDCYAGLVWTADNADELGIDPGRIMIAGQSAGGGLAAGVTLLARDRQGPALMASVLLCPMLDDRNETVSSYQIDGFGSWDRGSNLTGWNALLGDRRGTDGVSVYAAPARATDLSGLPPTFIDVGSAEVFRDEDVAYATAIWAAGGVAELHVWPGGFHGFDVLAPQAALSVMSTTTRDRWIARALDV